MRRRAGVAPPEKDSAALGNAPCLTSRAKARATEIVEVSSGEYYGDGYQDIMTRVPSIAKARRILGWEPKVGMDEAIRRTVEFYLTKRESRP